MSIGGKWRRLRAALRMGLTWAVGWGPVGVLIAIVWGGNSWISDGNPWDDWFMPLTLLGFIGGTVFSAFLRFAEGRRSLHELSLARIATWGALGGVLLGAIAVFAWSNDSGYGPIIWQRAALMVGAATLLSSGSAVGTLALARAAEDRELLDADAEILDAGLTADESRDLLSSGQN